MQTVISKHSRVPDYFVPLPTVTGAELVRTYESGCLLHGSLEDAGIEIRDPEALAWYLPVSNDNATKKMCIASMEAPLDETIWSRNRHALTRLTSGLAFARRIQAEARSLVAQMRRRVISWFPAYRVIGENITWRFTVTEHEEIHYDAYGDDSTDNHYVRFFINLDELPRLWGLSWPVTQMLRTFRSRCALGFHLHPNRLNAHVNRVVPWREVPRHYVAFAPGAVWLGNSQILAHEIVFGRRCLAGSFVIAPESMQDPQQSFVNSVRATIKELDHA